MMAMILRRAAVLALLLPSWAAAGPFELGVAPSRFELAAKPGTRVGQSLTLQNVSDQPADVAVRTLDWNMTPTGGITYVEDLAPGSCRPWVTLERRRLTLGPRARGTYRFQVDVPPDAPRGECRFMIALEGAEPAVTSRLGSGGAAMNLPVSGRIAIAVYIAVNGAQPKLEIQNLSTQPVQGRRLPTVTVTNAGDAHGRLDGALDATDARGQKFELVPDASPLLAGQTRTLAFSARTNTPNQKLEEPAFPIKASGRLDWENGSFKVEAEFK
ncbi:MAG: hypothetical protein K0R58_3839 [Ramlibacter sp.]|jgi:hypothetical protein|nr:hypothetical protein [Ramlibacter sp.]